MKFHFLDVTDVQSEQVRQALALYEASFPIEVREPQDVLRHGIERRAALAPSAFHFVVALDECGQTVALSTAHYLAEVNFGFVVYLVVDPALQGRGLGGYLLANVESLLQQDAEKVGKVLRGVVLETERDEDALSAVERDECRRRSRFFQRQGYAVLQDVEYVQPPLHADVPAVQLYLFIKRGDAADVPTGEELRRVVQAMYEQKYGEINGVPRAVLQQCMQMLSIPTGLLRL